MITLQTIKIGNLLKTIFKQKKYLLKFKSKLEQKCLPPFTHVFIFEGKAHVMAHYKQMSNHQLYLLMKSIPKGVLHHCHIDCCEDKQYYRKFILNDPIIYLANDMNSFKIGTKKQAGEENWLSMKQLREKFQTEEQLVHLISNLTMLNKEDHLKIASKQIKFWPIFEKKIINFFTILFSLHHFKKYMLYICEKFVNNGYDRLEFRSMISQLTEYDNQGNIVKIHPEAKYLQILDQVQLQIKLKYPSFTLGIVFFGLKMLSPEQNSQIFTKICQLNWNKTLGFDFVQEEDAYGDLSVYDSVLSKVLTKYQQLNYKKVYHAGETRDPMNKNIEIAVRSGSVRVGHGINILQRMEFLTQCKEISFEICPISNILTNIRDDTRIATAPALVSLGYALTLNPDDPGKFGYEDSTVDYFSSMISFKWTLKQLKLLGVHSINHAICSELQKQKLLESFNCKWDQWISDLILRA